MRPCQVIAGEMDRGQPFDSGDSPIEKLGVTASSSVKSNNRRPDPVLTHLGSKPCKKKTFLDDLSNSGPAVRLYREGRATGPPKD